MADENFDLQLVKEIAQPSDCGVDTPEWFALIAETAVLFASTIMGIAIIATRLFAHCTSKRRMASIIAAANRRLPEAVPALIPLLGGEFVEGLAADGTPTVIFRLNEALAADEGTQALALAALGQIVGDAAARKALPPAVLRGALQAIELAMQSKSTSIRTVAVRVRVIVANALDVQAPPPTGRAGSGWYVLTGAATLGIGAIVGLVISSSHGRGSHSV